MTDYLIVIAQLVDEGYFAGWEEDEREIGVNGPPDDYDSIDWRETEFTAPSQSTLDDEWYNHPEKYDRVLFRIVPLPDGRWEITPTKPYNIDGATEVTLTVNGIPLPSPTTLGDAVILDPSSNVKIGVLENYPHVEEMIRI